MATQKVANHLDISVDRAVHSVITTLSKATDLRLRLAAWRTVDAVVRCAGALLVADSASRTGLHRLAAFGILIVETEAGPGAAGRDVVETVKFASTSLAAAGPGASRHALVVFTGGAHAVFVIAALIVFETDPLAGIGVSGATIIHVAA